MIKTGKGPKCATSAKSIREAERRVEMLSLRLDGLTLAQIGERMGVGTPTVSRVISNALASHTREPAEELITLELGRCDFLLNEAMQTVKAYHPLIAAGRVVSGPVLDDTGQPVRNPETGDVLTRVLEDEAPKLAAIATAVRVMERRAKLLGLDAATKLQQEVTVSTDEKPAHDLQKLDMDEMHLYGYLLEKMHNPDSPDRAERPKLRDRVRELLTPFEIGVLQSVFRKLDIRYIAADTVSGLYSTPALPTP
jgi:DNA-binding CsgD family transcriptional regulator